MDSLFGETPKQLTLAERPPAGPAPSSPCRPPPGSLANLDDWLDFAEALLGRQDIAPDSLAATSPPSPKWRRTKTSWSPTSTCTWTRGRLAERFPWLDTVEEIAEAQGFFHWELRFASVFADGGFDIQVGNPPWVRPRMGREIDLGGA